MKKLVLVAGSTVVLVVLLTWSVVAFGAESIWFAFLVVWLPMAWLGTLSRVIDLRLPAAWFTLRRFEQDGRLYELLGVRLVKRLLRRGPLAVFNPHLHLPAERTPANLAALDQRMRDAEASHSILFVATLGVAAAEAAAGWWSTAGWIVLFNLLVNGYPVMLQRYNRALLHQRFDIANGSTPGPP